MVLRLGWAQTPARLGPSSRPNVGDNESCVREVPEVKDCADSFHNRAKGSGITLRNAVHNRNASQIFMIADPHQSDRSSETRARRKKWNWKSNILHISTVSLTTTKGGIERDGLRKSRNMYYSKCKSNATDGMEERRKTNSQVKF